MPAASAVSREIRNVRSKGFVIRGSAAHDAPPHRGAPPRRRARRRGRPPRDGACDRCHPAPRRRARGFPRQIPRRGGTRGCPVRQGRCQELRLGTTEDASTVVAVLTDRSCAEIAWTPDGTRVAFVIDSTEMSIYDAQTSKLAGIVRLLASEAAGLASRAASPSPRTAAPRPSTIARARIQAVAPAWSGCRSKELLAPAPSS